MQKNIESYPVHIFFQITFTDYIILFEYFFFITIFYLLVVLAEGEIHGLLL